MEAIPEKSLPPRQWKALVACPVSLGYARARLGQTLPALNRTFALQDFAMGASDGGRLRSNGNEDGSAIESAASRKPGDVRNEAGTSTKPLLGSEGRLPSDSGARRGE